MTKNWILIEKFLHIKLDRHLDGNHEFDTADHNPRHVRFMIIYANFHQKHQKSFFKVNTIKPNRIRLRKLMKMWQVSVIITKIAFLVTRSSFSSSFMSRDIHLKFEDEFLQVQWLGDNIEVFKRWILMGFWDIFSNESKSEFFEVWFE